MRLRCLWRALLPLVLMTILASSARAGDDWLPVPPEDVSMKDFPAAPGADAIYLYRQIDFDDVDGSAVYYCRIKVLTEQGTRYGDVHIALLKDLMVLTQLKARSIQPDGRVVPFEGQIYEKTVMQTGGRRVITKSFAFPDVKVGSILEFRYKLGWQQHYTWYAPDWIIPAELYTRRVKFSLRPGRFGGTLAWMGINLPDDLQPRVNSGVISLEVFNVPAFVEERYEPPEQTLKPRVEFYYRRVGIVSMDQFWQDAGKSWYTKAEEFTKQRKGITDAVSGNVAPSDPAETKLRKLYTRVQQIRNLSFERKKSAQENKREDLKENTNAEETLARGYGNEFDIENTYVALLRAAGLEAEVIVLGKRDERFFNEDVPDGRQLDAEVVHVKAGGTEWWLDPGTPHCPFGLLPWYKTDVRGLRIEVSGGSWVKTPAPSVAAGRTERRANLQIDETGAVRGSLEILFSGYPALHYRLQFLDSDEVQWRNDMEEIVKQWLPSGANLKLQDVAGLNGSEEPLKLTFTAEIPGFVATTGKRLIVPATLFRTDKAHPFSASSRQHPVYFSYPFQENDEVTLQAPAQYEIESLPLPHLVQSYYGNYDAKREASGPTMHLRRSMAVERYFINAVQYAPLRDFYNEVRSGDDEQVVLRIRE